MGDDLKSWSVRISAPNLEIVVSPHLEPSNASGSLLSPASVHIDQEGRVRDASSGEEVRGYMEVSSVGATTNTYCNGGGPLSTNLHCKNTSGTNTYCCDSPNGTNEFCCDDTPSR